jgi:hypothetical protein
MFVKITDSLELVPNSSFVLHSSDEDNTPHFACEYAIVFNEHSGKALQVSRLITDYSVSTGKSKNWHLGHNTVDQHYAMMEIINTGFAGEFQVGCYI